MCTVGPCKDYFPNLKHGDDGYVHPTTTTNKIQMDARLQRTPAFSDICMRLARAHARGHRQLALTNEMLTGSSVKAHNFSIPGTRRETLKYGEARVDYQSWQSLKLRLLTAGFYFVTTDRDSFIMKFSG